MKRIPAPVSEALILICEKCGKRESRSLMDDLKTQIKARGSKREFRVLRTSCMNVCPKRGVTLAVLRTHGESAFVVVDETSEITLDGILAMAAR